MSGLRPGLWLQVVSCVMLLVSAGLSVGQPDGATAQGNAPVSVPAARQATNVAIISIHGPIQGITATSFMRRLKLAEEQGADAVVVDLNTPGGELGAVLEICNAIKGSSISNIVAWVNPDAYSGGAIIALACREIVVNDPANMGDALIIAVSFGMLNTLPEAERQKLLSPLMAEIVDSARRRGHDEYLVQAFVTIGVELWLVENKETGQRICIDRDEYRAIFGEDPVGGTPRLASAKGNSGKGSMPRRVLPGQEEDASEEKADDEAAGADGELVPGEVADGVEDATGGSGMLEQFTDSEDPVRYRPASPKLEEIQSDVSVALELASDRPVITADDRGKWTLIEYVTDGKGPVVMKGRDMRHFGLATTTIRDESEMQAYFGAQNMRTLDPTWSEGLVGFLINPWVRGLLIAVFLIGLFLEMVSPGLMVPGLAAGVALVMLLAPPMLVGMASWWEIAAIGAGVLLIVLEIFVIPGFGIFGVAGLLVLFGGLVGTFVGNTGGGLFPDSQQGRNDLLFGVVTVVLSTSTAGIAIYFLSKHFGSLPVLSKLILKDSDDEDRDEMLTAMGTSHESPVAEGDVGEAVTTLRPSGRAVFGDEYVDVVADMGYIEAGAKVRVVSVNAFRIAVEADEENQA